MPTAAIPIAASVAGALVSKGGKTGSTSQVQSAEPWSGVQPGLHALYDAALQNFQGPGPQYYPGDTVAPMSPVTEQAQQAIYDRAMEGNPLLSAAQNQAAASIRGDYFNANPATQGLYDMAGTDYMSSSPWIQDLYASTGENFFANTPGMEGLFQTAQGDYLNANPYVDDMFNVASEGVGRQFRNNVMPGVASMFSTAGRYGSGQMAEGLGQAQQQYGSTLNNLATNIYGQNYANERQLQQAAQGQLGQFGLSSNAQRLNSLANLGGFGLQGRQQQLGALGELGSQFGKERLLQQQSAGMAPELANADYFDLGQLLNLGTAQDTRNQAIVNADKERYDFGQNAPNAELAFLASILSGAPGGTTSMNKTGTAPGNPLMGALGGYQLGQSLFAGSGMNSMGNSVFNPVTQTGGWSDTSLAPFFYGTGGTGS